MPSSAIGMRKNKLGFTLVELLVVLVIIGVALTFAVMATGDFGHKRHFRIQTEQLLDDISYARFYAMLSPATLSLTIDKQTLVWRFLDDSGAWKVSTHDKLLRTKHLPNTLRILSSTLNPKKPTILITPTGDIQPFKIVFQDPSSANTISLEATKQNELYVKENE